MMGEKTLKTVRAELLARFASEGIDLPKWLSAKIAHAKKGNDRDLETLQMLQRALASSSGPAKKKRANKAASPARKKIG